MTYVGAEYSVEDLFSILKDRVRHENVRSFEAYRELVEELIEEKKSYGFFSENEDLVQIQRDLELRWNELQNVAVAVGLKW